MLKRAPKFAGLVDGEPQRFNPRFASGGFAGYELRLIEVEIVK